jgi:hypothetical protein
LEGVVFGVVVVVALRLDAGVEEDARVDEEAGLSDEDVDSGRGGKP